MNYRILLLLGKILIIGTLVFSAFTFWMIGFSEKVWLPIMIFTLHILVGVSLCIHSSMRIPIEHTQQPSICDTPIHPFFQIVKWSTVVALGFQLIAAVIIAFFYCLEREFEATLIVCIITGFFLVFLIKGIEYFKNYKD